jgi:hypothetical protein
MPTPFVLGRNPIRREEGKRREKQKYPKVIPYSISPLPNPYSTDHPYPQVIYLGVGRFWTRQGGRELPLMTWH